jgi:hypothetical protein
MSEQSICKMLFLAFICLLTVGEFYLLLTYVNRDYAMVGLGISLGWIYEEFRKDWDN